MADRLTLADIEAVVAAARLKFAQDVDKVLDKIERWQALGSPLSTAQVRLEILTSFDQYLPAFAPADAAQLRQLVREAFDAFNDPDSRVDLREWNKEAKKVLTGSP